MDLAILGAGCSGSSLAWSLVSSGFEGEIHVFDSRTDFSREQRWCSWGPIPAWVEELVSASWERWAVGFGGERVVRSLPGRPYIHVYAPEFFRVIHERLEQHRNVHLHLGSAVTTVSRSPATNRPLLATPDGEIEVDHVFDSRPQRGTAGGGDEIRMKQSFVGLTVRCEGTSFEPGIATLMDFGVTPSADLSFVYVLPFRRDLALVESTAFSERTFSEKEHVRIVEDHLASMGVEDYSVEAKESGEVLMTTERLPAGAGEGHTMIGVAGGAARPSSGYAFVQILRESEVISKAMTNGHPIPGRLRHPKYAVLDEVFLEAMRTSPSLARESFMRMFERVPADSLVRFMSGESTLRDDAAMVLSLPKLPFVGAAVRRRGALGKVLGR